jgi:hypothetical protein
MPTERRQPGADGTFSGFEGAEGGGGATAAGGRHDEHQRSLVRRIMVHWRAAISYHQSLTP